MIFGKMKLDIDTILRLRLFAIRHTEHEKVYFQHLEETADLIQKIESGEVNYQMEDGFVYFYDEDETITNVAKIIQLEEVSEFDGISHKDDLKLYRWNYESKNELIFRNHGAEERKRLQYLPSGFYYVGNKIKEHGKYLYWVSQRLLKGEFTHHKTVGRKKGDTGTVYAFTERKNKGKIYKLVDYEHLLKDEAKQISPNHLIVSTYTAHNDVVFEKILRLYVPHGSVIADITYGLGNFWKKVPKGLYHVLSSDITTGVDCRSLPYPDDSIDCVVFDPPYVSTCFGNNSVFGKGTTFERCYKNEQSRKKTQHVDHKSLLELYFQTSKEVLRVLKSGGIYILKCQDECAGDRQRITHCEILNELSRHGFRIEDIFIVVRRQRPVIRDIHQKHARKNHSYFLVFKKKTKRTK